jgi:hypothetical protein
MPRARRKKSEGPDREHIFPATIVTDLVLQWKQAIEDGRDRESQYLLEDIIKKSEQMFRRFAQYEGFHHTVDLDSLVHKANSMMPKWLTYWKPKKGKLFSWLGKCAKNAFLAEVVKTSQYNKRYFSTDDSLEKFIGTEDHEVHRREVAKNHIERLKQLTSRWADDQIVECIRYHIISISENPEINKRILMLSGSYASGLSIDMSKWCYYWSLVSLRDAMYERVIPGYTDQDLFRMQHSYTYLPDLLNIITWKQMLQIVAVMGGMRMKVPTLTQIQETKTRYNIQRRMVRSDLDPDSVAAIAKESGVSQFTAQEIFEQMSQMLDGKNGGEVPIFDENDTESYANIGGVDHNAADPTDSDNL